MSILVTRSNFTLVFLKAACHANSGAERNFAGSSSYIFQGTCFYKAHVSKVVRYISNVLP